MKKRKGIWRCGGRGVDLPKFKSKFKLISTRSFRVKKIVENSHFIITGIFLLFYSIKETIIEHDGCFELYLGAAKLFSEGKPFYHAWIPSLINPVNAAQYSYSPFFAMLLIPFSYLNFTIVSFCFLLLNIFFLYRIWLILGNFFGIESLDEKETKILFWFTFLFMLRFLLNNFEQVQMNIFLLYASLESISLFNKNRWLVGSLLLSLSISIKILTIVFIPLLLYRRYFKEVFFTVIFTLLFTLSPIFLMDYTSFISTLKEWWTVINPYNPEFTFLNGEDIGAHNLSALISVYFYDMPNKFSIETNILALSKEQIAIILLIVRLVFVLFTLFFIRSMAFTRPKSKQQLLFETSYICLIIPLIFPQQQKYSFIFLLPSIYIILLQLIKNWKKKGFKTVICSLIVFFILTTLTTDAIIGSQWSDVTQYLKLITFGTIILILPLSLSRPKN